MLIFDELDNRNKIGEEFESKLKQTRNLRLISPYISSGSWNPQELFEKNRQLEHIDILCDLKNPACNPKTVRELSRDERISIKYMDKIHAKVYIFDNSVLVASANFTPNGMGEGLIEAGSVEENVECAERWYNSLWEKAGWVPDVNNEIAWNILIANWHNARQKRIRDLQSLSKENNTTHFWDLLKDGNKHDDIEFAFWYRSKKENENKDEYEECKRILSKQNNLISKLDFDMWDFFDDDWEDKDNQFCRDFEEYRDVVKQMNSKLFIAVQVSEKGKHKAQKSLVNISLARACGIQDKYSYRETTYLCNVFYDVDSAEECSCDDSEKNKKFIEKLYLACKKNEKKWENVFGDYGYASFETMRKFLKETKVLKD